MVRSLNKFLGLLVMGVALFSLAACGGDSGIEALCEESCAWEEACFSELSEPNCVETCVEEEGEEAEPASSACISASLDYFSCVNGADDPCDFEELEAQCGDAEAAMDSACQNRD